MSFHFNWPDFDAAFYDEAKQQLETALNKETKSKYIADHVFVKDLHMGSKPPELEILEIGELTTDYFRGIFKLTYSGDSYIELHTKVQANPLYNPPPLLKHLSFPRCSRPNIVAAAQPLVIPMLLRISDVKLNGIIVLSVSKTKGVTLVFKNDALLDLKVSSTFDIVPTIKSFLQHLIESRLRTFLQESLPLIVHEYSLRHRNDDQQQQRSPSSVSSLSSYYPYDLPDLTVDGLSDTSSECLSFTCGDSDTLFSSLGYNQHDDDDTMTTQMTCYHDNNDDFAPSISATGFIQRLADLSHATHTLALTPSPLVDLCVHKTTGPCRPRIKPPKRRIIRWNPLG